MTKMRIRLYNDFTERWRKAFQNVVARVVEAEFGRLGRRSRDLTRYSPAVRELSAWRVPAPER